ncbi:MAG: dTMP kinase [Actinomycetes bacterium]
MSQGRLITVEGIDGAGKTTLSGGIARALGHQHGIEIHLLREPGGVELAERIRELVKDPKLKVGGRAEALLYAAARAELVEQALLPLLASGSWVLLDRYVDSSLAYQGAARGLGIEEVLAINSFATNGLTPDRTLLLRLDAAEARQRMGGRGEATDRLEAEDDAFFVATARAYDQLAAAEPERFRVLDATLGPDDLLASALVALGDLIPA